MKRTTYKLTDEEAAIIDDLRESKRRNAPRKPKPEQPRCQAMMGLFGYGQCHNPAKYDGKWCGNHRTGRYKGVDERRNHWCGSCRGSELVCENHPDRPWGGASDSEDSCECGAGMPCQSCDNADRRREIAMQRL